MKFVQNHMEIKTGVVVWFCVLTAVVTIVLPAHTVLCTVVGMRFLQNNIQSLTTSVQLLRQTAHRHNIDVILLQEIWHPSDTNISIANYSKPITKVRGNSKGGGVAIIPHRNVKTVHLKEYDKDGLEAVWAEVMLGKVRTVIGSVYIPPGDINALTVLDGVISNILTDYSHLLIGMDANSRSNLWDDTCLGIPQCRRSVQMGNKLEEILDKYGLQVLNSGCPTYRSGNVATAPDVTLTTGIWQRNEIRWSVIDDDLRSPHEGILIDIGDKVEPSRKEIIDWKTFDWNKYQVATGISLRNLYMKWTVETDIDVDDMAGELASHIEKCVNDIATRKIVTNHSRPWISTDIAMQLKLLRQQKKKCRNRKSQANMSEYIRLRDETVEMLNKAERDWRQLQFEKLSVVNDSQKWKIIRRLTNEPNVPEVQPIRKIVQGKSVYLFEDDEIRQELEDHHIRKSSTQNYITTEDYILTSLRDMTQAAMSGKGSVVIMHQLLITKFAVRLAKVLLHPVRTNCHLN